MATGELDEFVEFGVVALYVGIAWHGEIPSLAPLSSPKGVFVLRPRSRERPWVPACAGMTMASGRPLLSLRWDPLGRPRSPSP